MNLCDLIYIPGHNGFVGKALYNELKHRGYNRVYVADKIFVDLSDSRRVNDWVRSLKPKYMIICAARVGGIQANMKNPYKFLYENLMIQNSLINAAIQNDIEKVVFLGSSCIYPKDREILREEDLLTGSMEETNLGYSLAKISGLKMCQYANEQFGKRFISLMPCNLFGENDHFNPETSHALAANIKRIVDAKYNNDEYITLWSNGTAKREWLHVSDLVDAIIWVMENLTHTETFLNVGYGTDISMLDLVKLICKIVGYNGEIKFDLTKPSGQKQKLMDSSKINKLGWKPKITLEEGIQRTVKFYIENYK